MRRRSRRQSLSRQRIAAEAIAASSATPLPLGGGRELDVDAAYVRAALVEASVCPTRPNDA